MVTSLEYAARGRYILWGMATANMYWELTDDEDDYFNDVIAVGGFVVATGALFIPEWFSWTVGRGASAAATSAAPYVAPVAVATAAVTTGYLIGAVAGTVIANEIWGEEGAQTAMGFYSGGMLPGTEAPDLTDYQYIFKPTAPGGPVSLYDIGATAVDTTVVIARSLWNKRPKLRRMRWKKPWMM
jgi:hypothetical protein